MLRVLLLALVASASAFVGPVRSRVLSHRAAVSMSIDVEAKVKEIICDQLSVNADLVTPDASFTEDLGADSLDAVELIMAIEEAFGVEIPDEVAETLTTPGECVALIQSKQS